MIRRLVAWFQSEARLLAAHSWEREDMRVDVPTASPLTSDDPRCAETIRRLAECRERMKRMRMGVLDNPNRKFTCSASTDVRATILKARAIAQSPVHAIARRAGR